MQRVTSECVPAACSCLFCSWHLRIALPGKGLSASELMASRGQTIAHGEGMCVGGWHPERAWQAICHFKLSSWALLGTGCQRAVTGSSRSWNTIHLPEKARQNFVSSTVLNVSRWGRRSQVFVLPHQYQRILHISISFSFNFLVHEAPKSLCFPYS